MSVGLLIVTHGEIGTALLNATVRMLGHCPMNVRLIAAPTDVDPDDLREEAEQAIDAVDQGEGVLILTDIYGGTPSNVARRLADGRRVCMISGVNLPMLVRLMNYPDLRSSELAKKAISGGRDGIFGSKAEGNV